MHLNNDAGCFFGWDYKTDTISSRKAFYDLVTGMVGEDVSKNGADALSQLSDKVRTSNSGGKLQIYDNGKDVYLPCFGKIVLQPDSPPSGTSYYEIKFSPYGSTESIRINASEEIEYDGVSPVDTRITVRAMSSAGNVIETGIVKPELISGENELLTITSWGTYGIILTADPSSVEPDGTSTSNITATVKIWKDTDVLKPTGDPISCKEVEFITNHGFFTDSEKVFTDINGKATVEIASKEEGTATIRAIVEEDGVESYKTVNVNFGVGPISYRFWDHTYTTEAEIESQGNYWTGKYHYRWRYWIVFDAVPGAVGYWVTVHSNEDINDFIEQGNPHMTQGNAGNFFEEDDSSLVKDFEEGKRFFLIAGQDGFYDPEDGPAALYTSRDEIIAGCQYWTFDIEPVTG